MLRPTPYLIREKTRHGKTVYYVRKGVGPRVRIRETPGTPEFATAYEAALNATPPDPDRSFVYFALAGNRVKIGHSKDPRRRIATLKTGTPQKVRIYYATPGGKQLERSLHEMFADDRVNGEWFVWSSRIKNWIVQDEARRRANA